MEGGAVCLQCHAKNKFAVTGATIAGAEAARALRASLKHLKAGIDQADATLTEAERLGMEVSQPKFDLRNATNALTNARTLIHAFKVPTVKAAVDEGDKVVVEVQAKANQALRSTANVASGWPHRWRPSSW